MIVRELITKLGFATDETGLKRFEQGMKNVRNGVKAFAVGLAAVNTALTGMTLFAAKAGDSAAKVADKLGIGIEPLQEWRYAAELAGIAQNTFDMALQRFTRRAAEAAAGTGEAKDALAELGITLTDANGNVRDNSVLLEEVADALSAIPDQARRVRLAFKLFDSEGVSMVNLLSKGSAETRKLRQEFRDLGGVISEDAARSSEEFLDNLERAKTAITGLRNRIGISLMPSLNELLLKFDKWIKANQGLINTKLEGWVTNISNGFELIWQFGKRIGKTLNDVVQKIGGWGVVAAVVAVIAVYFYWVQAAILLAILALDDFFGWLNGQDSILGRLLGSWDNFKDKVIGVWQSIRDASDGAVGELFDKFGVVVKEAWDVVKAFGKFLIDVWSEPKQATIEFVNELKDYFQAGVDFITDLIGLAWKHIANGDLWKGVKWLLEKVDYLASGITSGALEATGVYNFLSDNGTSPQLALSAGTSYSNPSYQFKNEFNIHTQPGTTTETAMQLSEMVDEKLQKEIRLADSNFREN